MKDHAIIVREYPSGHARCTNCGRWVHIVFHQHPDRQTTTTWAHNPIRKP